MSKSTTTPTVDEATAVVEYGTPAEYIAALDAESMLPRALNAFTQAELIQAFDVVAGWNVSDHVLQFHRLAQETAANASLTPEVALDLILQSIAGLNLDDDTRVGNGKGVTTSNRVGFSTDEDFDPTDPHIVFLAIRPSAGMFVAGEREAMAVAFYPNKMITFTDRATNELVSTPDWKDYESFSHVIRWYPSVRSARDAKDELRSALGTVRKASRALRQAEYEADPIRTAGMDEVGNGSPTASAKNTYASPF